MAPLSQSVPPPGAGGALRGSPHPAAVVVLAGVCAALHVGKLAPALAALQQQLGLDLVLSGFLLSTVQLAGLLLGLAVGLSAGSLGLRRCLLGGLAVLTLASLAGGLARQVGLLLALRALEGLGFLLVVMPAPALIRQLETARRLPARLGWWGSYMPLGTALALLAGPVVVAGPGWPAWWWLLAGVTALMAVAVWHWVPAPERVDLGAAPAPQAVPWRARLRRTLGDPGPWLVALCFAVYSAQWLAVIGFLPLLYTAAGLPLAWGGVFMATAALSNGFGNVAAGRLLQRGWPPQRLLRLGFAGMAGGAWLAYAGWTAAGAGAPWRLAGLLMFSASGGLVPGTLFSLAVRLAPGEDTVATTVGWMQQWSALGQFLGPPLVGWLAALAGGWHWTWLATGSLCGLGLWLAWAVAQRLALPRP